MIQRIKRALRLRKTRKLLQRLYDNAPMSFVFPWEPCHPAYRSNRTSFEDPGHPYHERYMAARLENYPDDFFVVDAQFLPISPRCETFIEARDFMEGIKHESDILSIIRGDGSVAFDGYEENYGVPWNNSHLDRG